MQTTDVTRSLLLFYENPTLGQLVEEYLQRLGFRTFLAADKLSLDVKKALTDREYDLCMIHLAGEVGKTSGILREIREIRDLPVFVCTADLQDVDKQTVIELYKEGADDVITQPTSTEIMALKIEAILRRTNRQEAPQRLFEIGNLMFDSELQTLSQNGEVLQHLSGKESELLEMLMKNQNQLVERGYILRKIWGIDNYFNGRSLSVYVNHLRHMLEPEPSVKILSIHGKGYKLCIDDEVINISFRED